MGQAETISHDNEYGRENQMLTHDLWVEISASCAKWGNL